MDRYHPVAPAFVHEILRWEGSSTEDQHSPKVVDDGFKSLPSCQRFQKVHGCVLLTESAAVQ